MTQSSNATFEKLPAELLQRIASLGPCESTLALAKVSKKVRDACNDRQVYIAVIKNCNGYEGSSWNSVPLTNESPLSSWARYALADSKARQWLDRDFSGEIEAPSHQLSLFRRKFFTWAPQIMAASHPLVELASALQLARLLCEDKMYNDETGDDPVAVAICFALRLLSKKPVDDLMPVPRMDSKGAEIRNVLQTDLLTSPLLELEDSQLINQSGLSFQECWSRAIAGVGFLATLLRETLHTGKVKPEWGGFMHPFPPSELVIPTVQSLGSQCIVDFPLPFTESPKGEIATLHLKRTTDQEFLTNGDWTGIYAMSFSHWESIHFDPPMRDVRFTATPDPAHPRIVEFRAIGWDHIGDFKLDGRMNQATGAIKAQKSYNAPGHQFDWSCLMTPFGIVGSWGAFPWGGWVWLWKIPKSARSFMPTRSIFPPFSVDPVSS
ncbi:hypothetical protein ACLMJK_000019 [Lecanora helva]